MSLKSIGTSLSDSLRVARKLGGPSTSGRAALFLKLVSIPARKKIFGIRPVEIAIRFKEQTRHIYIRDSADIAILKEIFVEEEYALSEPCELKRIVDIGGHIGMATIYFSLTYPNATIDVYEPDPRNFKLLQMNTSQNPAIKTHQAALGAATGEADFFSDQSSISSSLISRGGKDAVRVKVVSLDTVLSSPVDLLKFDIEGAEYDLFSHATRVADCNRYIGEVHYDLIPQSRDTFLALFSRFAVTERPIGPRRSILELKLKS